MNDPYLLYHIARFADTSVLLNLTRASRQFHKLVAENHSVKYDLMDCYAINGLVKCSDGNGYLKHGKIVYSNRIEYCRADKWHRDGDLPAIIYTNGTKEWYQNGECHRDGDLPALVFDDFQGWYQHGELHRDGDLPARIFRNGTKEWYKFGKFRGAYNPKYPWMCHIIKGWHIH